MATYEAHTISISIEREWREVYDFGSVPENFPQRASGLGSGLQRSGESWIAQGPEWPIRIRFAPSNDFGVLGARRGDPESHASRRQWKRLRSHVHRISNARQEPAKPSPPTSGGWNAICRC